MAGQEVNEVGLSREKLLSDKFRSLGVGPTRIYHKVDGRTTLVWHVDDDDDRFVEVADSVKRGGGYLLVVRDGDLAEAAVWHSEAVLVDRVLSKLSVLATRRDS